MSDTRFDALKWYRQSKISLLFNTSTFFGNFALAAVLAYFFRALGYDDAVNFVFFIGALAVGLWITEAVPPFAVSIFIVVALLFGFGTDYMIPVKTPVDIYLGTWTSNVIWLLLGGFFLAEGMRQVELDKALFRFAVERFGAKPQSLLLGLMLITATASMVMSNTATTAMMISSILPLIRALGKENGYSKALLIAIPASASVGGVGTIIGSTPNAIAVGALKEIGVNVTFVEWMFFGIPAAFVMIILFYKFLMRKLALEQISLDLSQILQERAQADTFKRNAVLFTLAVTLTLWMTEALHGIPVAGTSAAPILLLTLTRVIDSTQVRALPWDTLMLVAGGLALGIAMVEVGLARIAMNAINQLPLPTVMVAILFSLIAVSLSNVMSNTAAASILMPLAIALPSPFNVATPIIVALSCACALLLPVSTPPNAIAFATGYVEQKDFRMGGVFFFALGPLAAFIAAMVWALIKTQPA